MTTGHGYIVLAAYHPDGKRLTLQLRSIAAQTVRDWTCLVVGDGPHPELEGQVQEIVCDDPRFQVVDYPEQVGFYRNFERGLRLVPGTARWVALADQDDEWFDTKLEVLLPELEHSALVVGQADVVIDGVVRGRTHRTAPDLDALIVDNQVTGSLSVFRRTLLDTALPFPDAGDLAFHDHWLGVCASAGEGLATVPWVVQNYVQHEGNVIGEEHGRSIRERLAVLSAHAHGWRHVLVADRLGWRRAMARSALRHGGGPSPHDPTLQRWAHGRWTLGARIVRLVATGQVPRMRGLALAAAVAIETGRTEEVAG